MNTKKSKNHILALIAAAVLGAFGGAASAAEAKTTADAQVSYYKDIRPVFQSACQGCHQPAKNKGGYVMTDFKKMLAGGDSADKAKAIVPGKPDDSLLFEMLAPGKDGEVEMPPKGHPLSKEDVALIRKWIAQGAKDDTPANAVQTRIAEQAANNRRIIM